MNTLTVTTRGQVTFRKEVLQHLGVHPGEKIELHLLPGGRAERRAAQPKGSYTNVLLRALVTDAAAQTTRAIDLLETADMVAVSLQTLCEWVWVLQEGRACHAACLPTLCRFKRRHRSGLRRPGILPGAPHAGAIGTGVPPPAARRGPAVAHAARLPGR
ncbi:hypothetical protein [Verminephrobacter aporrectodeae]|uniref:hypothetical protein n=1 Tax=Verminephrobacter aporrectodeae TaxID=1110389 RepID=UPI0002377A8C